MLTTGPPYTESYFCCCLSLFVCSVVSEDHPVVIYALLNKNSVEGRSELGVRVYGYFLFSPMCGCTIISTFSNSFIKILYRRLKSMYAWMCILDVVNT